MLVDILAIHRAEMRKIIAVARPSPQGHTAEDTQPVSSVPAPSVEMHWPNLHQKVTPEPACDSKAVCCYW